MRYDVVAGAGATHRSQWVSVGAFHRAARHPLLDVPITRLRAGSAKCCGESVLDVRAFQPGPAPATHAITPSGRCQAPHLDVDGPRAAEEPSAERGQGSRPWEADAITLPPRLVVPEPGAWHWTEAMAARALGPGPGRGTGGVKQVRQAGESASWGLVFSFPCSSHDGSPNSEPQCAQSVT